MRADVRRVVRASVIPSAILALSLGGCRTAGVPGRMDRDQIETVARSAETAEIAALPEGAGKTLVTERCLMCHGAALITQQRKDAAAWGRTVTQMRTWGTPIQDEDQTSLVAYLTQHFGTASVRR